MDAEGNIISDDESSLPAEDKKEEDDDRYELLGENFETFRKRLKFLNRYLPGLLYQEIFRSKNPGKYTKELRKQHQAKLSRTLHRRTYERLGVKERLYDVKLYEELSRRGPETTSDSLELLKGKLSRLRLSNLSIFPEVVTGTRREMIGTLEAYLNGFRYSAFGTPFHIDVMYSNVKHAFFQDKEENKAGDEIISPLLHLHLHNPIKVGTKMKNDIQFRMMYISRRRKRSAHHSCKFEDLNQVMRNFLLKLVVFGDSFLTLHGETYKGCMDSRGNIP
ncbi:hypothetical protein MKW92_012412 [Papaver armeniacum]|nr:hypothetical protein MKW92_012412 [Papaver armeniacum]